MQLPRYLPHLSSFGCHVIGYFDLVKAKYVIVDRFTTEWDAKEATKE